MLGSPELEVSMSDSNPPLLQRPVAELVELMTRKQLSPVELMEETLERIDGYDGALNAVVALGNRESLLEAARDARERYEKSEARSLEGIPLGVKDLEDAVGFATTFGSVPFKDHVPERDSVQVERLKAAGAIVVGKTNTPEFGATAITKN
ncbi:MAG: amidase, partial [Deltaproteobacteria bacterium]